MNDENKTKEQLINELVELRKRITEIERSESQCRLAEKELQEAEARYQSIFENAVEGIFQTTPDGHFLSINPSFARMLGYDSPKEVMSEVTDARQFFIDPSRRKEFIRLMQANGIVTGFENQVRRKDGSTIWISENVRTLKDTTGRLVGYEGMAIDITKRKRAEHELMAEMEKLDSIVKGIGAGLSLLDSDARLIWANDILQKWFGPIEKLKGKFCHELYYLTDPQKECSAICTLRSGQIERGESFAEVINGERRCFQLTTAPIKDDKGNIIQMVELTQDITERKRAEKALLESEKRYRSLFEDSPISLWEEDFSDIKKYIDSLCDSGIKDFRTYFDNHPEDVANCARMVRIVDVNKATWELFKAKSKEELLGNLRTVFDDEEGKAFKEELIAIAEGKPNFEIEAINQTLTGEKKYINLRWSMSPDYEASWSKVLISVTDLTERKKAEEKLREAEIRYHALFCQSPDGVLIIAPQTTQAIEFNEAAHRQLGYTREEFKRLRTFDYEAKEKLEETKAHIEKVLHEGRDDFETQHRTKDGELRNVLATVKTIELQDRQVLHCIFRDITERKQVEEKLNHTLEELKRSNEELEQFAYIASHDLQEPLRNIANFSQLLAKRYEGKIDTKADQFIFFIVDGATRMQGMIDDLLAYSRVSTRAKPLEPTNCETVFNTAVDNLKAGIYESSASVTYDPLPDVMADGSQMVQLFQNLISNAIKFRGKKQPHVHVSAEQKGNEWFFSVKDNGIGIAPEFMEHIFKMFQREHTRAEYPGTGIGLAICKKIVERHGGRIWVKSEQSKGSTFYFTIPAKRGQQP